jgi:cytochrome b
MVRVWDAPVRVLHWALVASVVLAWTTTAWFGQWHKAVGYAGLAVLVARVAWGFVGSRHARFAQFVRGAGPTWRYLKLALRGREPRHVGHNPLGACMVLAMIACLSGLAFTGWLYTTDRFWGDETVERIHLALAWTIVVLAVLHVTGVVIASVRHRENLVAAMATGDKREARGSDIE